MANNYSSGTVQTNFDEEQSRFFLTAYAAYIAHETSTEFSTIEEAVEAVASDITEFQTLEHDEDGQFWEMEGFDWHAVEYAVEQTFKRFPNSKLTAEAGVAFHCSKPRMGEFGGQQESWKQDE